MKNVEISATLAGNKSPPQRDQLAGRLWPFAGVAQGSYKEVLVGNLWPAVPQTLLISSERSGKVKLS
jgi:hypothetical protein